MVVGGTIEDIAAVSGPWRHGRGKETATDIAVVEDARKGVSMAVVEIAEALGDAYIIGKQRSTGHIAQRQRLPAIVVAKAQVPVNAKSQLSRDLRSEQNVRFVLAAQTPPEPRQRQPRRQVEPVVLVACRHPPRQPRLGIAVVGGVEGLRVLSHCRLPFVSRS